MSSIWKVIKSIFKSKSYVEVKLNELPSMGIFYPDDFSIKIKKASEEDISTYDSKYIDGNFMSIFMGVKYVVKENIKLPTGYSFNHVVSIDVLYLFLEIVKHTTSKEIVIMSSNGEKIKFCSDNFNYFDIKDEYEKIFDESNKEFVYKGFKYSLPSVGAESCIARFMYEMSIDNKLDKYADSNYDFLYFLGGKTHLSNDEILNLITIFNDEMPVKDRKSINRIVEEFRPLSKYTIKTKTGVIPLDGIDLKHIWNN